MLGLSKVASKYYYYFKFIEGNVFEKILVPSVIIAQISVPEGFVRLF